MTMPLALPFDAWPNSDKQMWQALFHRGGLLDDAGALSHLRLTTQEMLCKHYARWIGWLGKADPAALLQPPPQRLTAGRLEAWLEALAHTSPVTQHMFVSSVFRVLSSVDPDQDWAVQDRAIKWLDYRAKNHQSHRKDGRVLSSAVLFEAGLRYSGPDADAASTSLKAAKFRRDGAMVALLTMIPMRRRSFIELDLDKSFEVAKDHITVHLSGDMTKNKLPWEAAVPTALEPILRRYVEEVRPWFLSRGGQSHSLLWVDDRGAPYKANYFGYRISQITEHLTGVRVSPHLFRDAAATTLSRASPKDARLIRPLLAHASFGTAERHYIQACTIEAGKRYAKILDKEMG
ncbi:MAG: tyrosine-type recombinase/integrase [Paracoccaceae bacterium]|nr:tyrosine-type recombinase/integrase [Paracoccaceae bacterium]